ncbi:MAG TPA: ABC transporter ATP-binding protein [Gemmatimonadales bacterium]|nr:ABC transporter ATP-binding protein [Gemmatimonadales bacterium]
MIRLEGLTVQSGPFALADVTFDVPPSGYGLVIGPTGSGKTTLLEAIAGHLRPRAGRVLLDGRDASDLPPEARGVGFVYQQYHLFPHLTVAENIAYGLRRVPAGRRERVASLAAMLGITDLLGRTVHRLSGGEQQRVAIARALAPRPRVLLLDEPFAALDPATRRSLRRELRALHEREGTTTLQVTHDFDEALRLGERVAVLAEGRIAQAGTPEEVFRHPNSAFVARFIGAGNVIPGTVRWSAAPPEGGQAGAATFDAGAFVLDVLAEEDGPAHAVLRPEDLTLSRQIPEGSARNHLRATVVQLERTGPVTFVHLDAGRPLLASLTTASVESLALAPGVPVVATCKATAVLLV